MRIRPYSYFGFHERRTEYFEDFMLIKGESSFWVNRSDLSNTKFEWQDEFIAVSVSESVLPKVREYIKNQEEHHKIEDFCRRI